MSSAATKQLLEQAVILSLTVKEERSTTLQPVRDGGRGRLVQPWRNSSHLQEYPLHRMMSRVGSFPPSLARYFIALYSKPNDVILDPFCGKGTSLLEAALMGRRAIGGDISPEAVISTRAKTAAITAATAANYIQGLVIPPRQEIGGIPSSVSLFFHRQTLRQIVSIRDQLLVDMQKKNKSQVATFFMGVLLGLLHGHSALSLSLPCNQSFAMSPAYVRRYVKQHGLKRPIRDVKKCLLEKAIEILPFPCSMKPATIVEAPACRCDEYMSKEDEKADLVITSPPYLNRQTYIRDARLRLWLLNRDRQEIARDSLETGNIERFVAGMARTIVAISKATRKTGVVIFVCGRAKIRDASQYCIVRISDLCLLANTRVPKQFRLKPQKVIVDKKMMKRGAYFAVHHGKSTDGNGHNVRRFNEDEILIFKKP